MTSCTTTSLTRIFGVLAVTFLTSCSDQKSGEQDVVSLQTVYHLSVASGDGQTARVRNDIPSPVTVRLMDGTSRPVPSAPIYWTIQTGAGVVTPMAATTDDQGYASAVWTLGPTAELQRLKASYGSESVVISASAEAGDPVSVTSAAGDAQSAMAGTRLTDSVAVVVQDEDGNPVPNVVVNWEVIFGGGEVSPASAVTGPNGIARTAWTLGLELGGAVVRAFVPEVGESRFSANILDSEGRSHPTAVNRLILTPEGVSLASIGAQTVLTATAYNERGQRLPSVSIDWSSLGTGVARVDEEGRVTAMGPGSTRVVANARCCNKADTSAVVVTQQATSITISPKPTNVPVGGTKKLVVSALDAYSNPVPSTPVSWSSSNTTVATVSEGTVSGLKSGTVKIRAASGSLLDSATVTVGSVTITPSVSAVVVSPASMSIEVTKTREVWATVQDAAGNSLSGQSISWSSSNPAVATVSSTGRVTGVASGTTTVKATSGGKTGSAEINVTSSIAPSLASVVISPATATLAKGNTLQLNASARDASGNTLSGYTFAWSTLNPSIASVSSMGMVNALAAGTANISVSAGGKIASATITVTASANVARVVVTPDPVNFTALGASSSLSAAAYDAGGQVLAGTSMTWKSTNAMIASVDSLARVTARAVGTALIIGTAVCCNKADTITVNVTQQIKSVSVSPHATSITSGTSGTLTGKALDGNAHVIPGAVLTWSTSNAAVATVINGIVAAVGSGTAVIRAASGTYKDSAFVTVSSLSAPIASSLSLNPPSATYMVGDSAKLSAIVKDQNGNTLSWAVTWTSSDPNVVSVSQGSVRALGTGVAVIRASTSSTLSDSSIITVLPAGQFSPPDIASTNFDSGDSDPFLSGAGVTTGGADITFINDPTGLFSGKVAEYHFVRTNTSSAPDVDRALRVTRGVHWGESVFIRGHVMIPTPQSGMGGAMRKLIYVQTSQPSSSFGVIRANGQTLYAEFSGTNTTARVATIGAFPFDAKHSIEVQITVNSAAGVPDGVLRVWLNGALMVDLGDVNWIKAADASMNFSRFLFGQQTQNTTTSLFDEYRYWDNLAVSTKRIGP